jgi:hypothetical protein
MDDASEERRRRTKGSGLNSGAKLSIWRKQKLKTQK